jgi:hypothetical protein
MARLMERLQKVDSDSPTDSSISALPERNVDPKVELKDEKKEAKEETQKKGTTVCFRDLAKLNLPMVVRF